MLERLSPWERGFFFQLTAQSISSRFLPPSRVKTEGQLVPKHGGKGGDTGLESTYGTLVAQLGSTGEAGFWGGVG